MEQDHTADWMGVNMGSLPKKLLEDQDLDLYRRPRSKHSQPRPLREKGRFEAVY